MKRGSGEATRSQVYVGAAAPPGGQAKAVAAAAERVDWSGEGSSGAQPFYNSSKMYALAVHNSRTTKSSPIGYAKMKSAARARLRFKCLAPTWFSVVTLFSRRFDSVLVRLSRLIKPGGHAEVIAIEGEWCKLRADQSWRDGDGMAFDGDHGWASLIATDKTGRPHRMLAPLVG